jgi:hypothetical protein
MLASGKAKLNDNIVVVRWSTPEECELGIASDTVADLVNRFNADPAPVKEKRSR